MDKSNHSCLRLWLKLKLTQTLASRKMKEEGRMKSVRMKKLKVEGKWKLSETGTSLKQENKVMENNNKWGKYRISGM